MQQDDFSLPVTEESAALARGWLKLGVLALLASGLFSVLLVASRTPGVHAYIPWVDFFHVALVVHVDLSVVIWFLAFAGVFWSLGGGGGPVILNKAALALMALGTLILAVAPFLGAGQPLMNNYVPVLQHPLFYSAGGLITAGFGLLILYGLISGPALNSPVALPDILRTGIYCSMLAAALALVALLVSFLSLPGNMDAAAYFESLFWGSGHVLQFTHTLLLLTAWLWLASAAGFTLPLKPVPGIVLMLIVVLPLLAVPVIYLSDEVISAHHRIAFTDLMKYGGLASLPLGILILRGLLSGAGTTDPMQKIFRSALYSSVFLFAAGGVIGFLIDGVNVVIPAHYHGSIVGVTLAFMGISYLLLPRLGYAKPMPRTARIQPYVYGGGQFMHILGLAISGGYGNIQRKTAGAAQGLDNLPEVLGMGLMGLGGLVSIIGGMLFLIVAIRAIWFGK